MLLSIFKFADTAIKALTNGDNKTGFTYQCNQCVIPDTIKRLLQTRYPNKYGLATTGTSPSDTDARTLEPTPPVSTQSSHSNIPTNSLLPLVSPKRHQLQNP